MARLVTLPRLAVALLTMTWGVFFFHVLVTLWWGKRSRLPVSPR